MILIPLRPQQSLASVEIIELINITNTPPGFLESEPVWSPDGAKIAYLGDCDYTGGGGGYSVWVMNKDGSNKTKLLGPWAGSNLGPDDWSPDGSTIAFKKMVVGDGDLWVMNSNGTDPKQITFDSSMEDLAAYNPSGDTIAFVKGIYNYEPLNIWLMNPDGSNQRQLTDGLGDYSPRWSPDGSKIVFTRKPGRYVGHPQICVINVFDGTVVQFTNDESDYSWPS